MNVLKKLTEKNSTFKVPSYCTAIDTVLKILHENAKEKRLPVLIEATANQVNQFGGYTGMKPADFVKFVYDIADEVACPKELIILGGDHLGPLTFAKENEAEAMEKSKELVRQYVLAGFTKIHLDTSMRVGDDDVNVPLSTEVIAKRGAILYGECVKAFDEIKCENKVRPVFVIGSEVPIPGGATEFEESVSVTKVDDFEDTVKIYKKVFDEYGYKNAFDDIVGVVVQPGVEFSDSQVFAYDPVAAKDLCDALKNYEGLVFEGHSTDYQTKEDLKNMTDDNIAILKVGPALTYRYREALFMLSHMEKDMISADKRANFIEVLEEVMLENPGNWNRHYHGDEKTLELARKYSYSDRCRYYFGNERVKTAIEKLIENFKGVEIPMNILHQFMPASYQKIIRGKLENNTYALIKDAVLEIIEDYEYACN